jgi:hypothetical protein
MCLIVVQPAGVTLPRERLLTVGKRNPDGFGWALQHAPEGEAPSVAHGRFIGASPEEIADFYREHLAGRSCVIHWRLATSGPKDAAHAHPFPLSDAPGAPVLFHNGVFSSLGCKTESDTAEIVRTLVRPITKDGADVRALDTLGPIWRRLVDGSAVVILAPDKIHRWGKEGTTYEGAWYSNTYAWDYPRPIYSYNGSGRYYGTAPRGKPACQHLKCPWERCEATALDERPATVGPSPVWLPRGESRIVKAAARSAYLGPSVARTALQIAEDSDLHTIATDPGRLTVAQRDTVLRVAATRRGAVAPAPAPAPAVLPPLQDDLFDDLTPEQHAMLDELGYLD